MRGIDLNCDLGESFGAYTIGDDRAVIPLITSANVACGAHAGDPVVLAETIALCKAHGVSVGAHPGFPDLLGFGRRNMALSHKEAKLYVQYQVCAAAGMAAAQGVRLRHVKLHGALYNMAGVDLGLAQAVCEGIAEVDKGLVLLALSGSQMIRAGQEAGLAVASEVFADRAYEPDGNLVARSKPGAMIEDEDEAVRRVVGMARAGTVEAITGARISIQADSVCVHGDGPKALAFAQRIRAALEAGGIQVRGI
jgi:UPF0271 protein